MASTGCMHGTTQFGCDQPSVVPVRSRCAAAARCGLSFLFGGSNLARHVICGMTAMSEDPFFCIREIPFGVGGRVAITECETECVVACT